MRCWINYVNTTLKKELELLELYLSIEKVRFVERLTIAIQIKEDVLHCQVPSMLLQPLVENAIKYAIEPRKEGGIVTIIAKESLGRLIIEVADNGNGQNDKVSNGFGIGMTNTKARLDAMFNGDYDLTIKENNQQGTTVTISTPFES